MNVEKYDLGPVLLTPRRFEDERGFFAETFADARFRAAVADVTFVQDNHSMSRRAGTVRGLHYQAPPAAQGKLVRVVRGAILDVAVDIRHGSPTFGQHLAVELSAENFAQLFVPEGFAHGFCTLAPDTEVVYKVTAPYAPDYDLGLAFDDPDLAIDWPVPRSELVLSDKDRRHPRLCELPHHFVTT